MAYLNLTLDELPEDSFEPVPPGIYKAHIVTDEIKRSNNGNNYLEIQWEILEGREAGRKVFDRIHFWSQNETAAKIAATTIRRIWEGVNASKVLLGKQPVHTFDNTELLYFIPVMIDVRIKKGTGDYRDSNEIKSYKPIAAPQGPAQPAPQPPMQQAPPPQALSHNQGPPPTQQLTAGQNGANLFPWQR